MAGLGEVLANLNKWAMDKRIACEAVSAVTAANMTNYAKLNKRWKDRTGNARARLHGGFYWEDTNILKTYIAHGMEYGIYLELKYDGKYAILEETINAHKNTWYKNIEKVMNK